MTKKEPGKKKKTKSTPTTAVCGSDNHTVPKTTADAFPIVGLGASAGGLEALKSFLGAVPAHSRISFIIVVHMMSKQPSILTELLQKATVLPVATLKDGQPIQPGHVYVNPPDKTIFVDHGKIQLLDVVKKGVNHPINLFFKSLAQDQGRHAAAVILSGTGTDGTSGIKEIKANDGLVLVQSKETAHYDGMPSSAINTGIVDMVLRPAEMPEKLTQYFNRILTVPTRQIQPSAMVDYRQEWLNRIFAILRAQIGYNFSAYKVNTILRRIDRRMGLHQIDHHNEYVRFLEDNPGEVESLSRELLIGVTSFFRDAESFETLKTHILSIPFDHIQENDTFRAWLPGCSTGEEVYSMIMMLHECLDKIPKRINLQLFGTDIDKYAVEKAREGLFPASIASDVTPQRLKRFFIKEGDAYRVHKAVRDCAVFSVQDVIKDPPFSRLNLLCCRNLLIYLNNEAQKKLLPLFHYTLIPDGIMMLGSSETIGPFSGLFEMLDNRWKIFRRREVPRALQKLADFPSGSSNPAPDQDTLPPTLFPLARQLDVSSATQKVILDQFAPTAVLTDTKGEILFICGRSGKYLEPPSGPPTQNILELARDGLRIELASALRAAATSNKAIVRTGISVKTNGDVQMIDLHVIRQHSPKEIAGRLLVVFEDNKAACYRSDANQALPVDATIAPDRITELEKELQTTREIHQTTVEELETSNEELKSTNEELQSTNEELQSTNEELESSKEELQSLNEELQTLNNELQNKVDELCLTQDDMRNLLNSTEIATIFVDNDIRVRRFTPEATVIVNLIQTDIGRPLTHVVTNLVYTAMIKDIAEVLKNLTPKVVEVQTKEGKWYTMRILPYRTIDNRIDGSVLTFSFIGEQKKIQGRLKALNLEITEAWQTTRAIFDMNSDPMVVIDENGKMVIANTTFRNILGIDQTELEKRTIHDLDEFIPKSLDLKSKLKTQLEKSKDFTTTTFKLKSTNHTQIYSINGRMIPCAQNHQYRLLLKFIPAR